MNESHECRGCSVTSANFATLFFGKHIVEKDHLRDVEISEVNKMLSCKDESRGFFTYLCERCGTMLRVHFGCNRRICSNCGKNHTDKWVKSLQNALFNVPHRHAVLTIPSALWQS
ncbi:MAG: hypothetical protein EF813_06945 [Methanosarcinales archaeon]|nr:MAG: hypothetical protein EF813_06945 [Methanosarcinales archaeon]